MPGTRVLSIMIPGLVLFLSLVSPSLESVIADSKFTQDNSEKRRYGKDPVSGLQKFLAVVCLIWYATVLALAYSGWIEIVRKFRGLRGLADAGDSREPVSIIRPCKGIDTEMASCLESSILQAYATDRFEVLFCVESPQDPCIPVIKGLLEKYPDYDLKLLVGINGSEDHYGPNPKINNLSKAYRHAKYDIIWVLDSNVWCSPGTLSRSVASLTKSLDNGTKTRSRPVVLTHHVPLAISVAQSPLSLPLSARLDEMFMFSSHAKFYVGFNKVSIAPCVNGKSNLYRRSDLDKAVEYVGQATRRTDLFRDPQIQQDARMIALKNKASQDDHHLPFTEYVVVANKLQSRDVPAEEQQHHHGIEFFSTYIGEDNMIGTALWDMLGGRTGMTMDAVVQPLRFGAKDEGLRNFINRRVRWLRVRKYMVLAATLLEPTTESIVIGFMGAFWASRLLHLRFRLFFCMHLLIWCLTDWIQYCILSKVVFMDDQIRELPAFLSQAGRRRSFWDWLRIWVLREILALPIWIKAMCGSVIDWRNKPFRIKPDLTAEELQ